VLAVAAEVATAVLILRLPVPGTAGEARPLYVIQEERAQNRERRNEYLGAGGIEYLGASGIVVVALLGAAVMAGRIGRAAGVGSSWWRPGAWGRAG
jgi:hypothetical protein